MQNANKTYNFVNKLEKLQEHKEKGTQPTAEEKIRVAVLADSPTVVTGFANVAREVLSDLHETGLYQFDIVGINHDGSPHGYPFQIWPAVNALMPDPAYRDVFGRQAFLDLLGKGEYDLVWVLQDSFIVEELCQRIVETNEALPADRKFAFIYYFPIDSTPKKAWIDNTALLADFPVVYTKYGYDEVLKTYYVDENSLLDKKDQELHRKQYEAIQNKLNVIYHGVNMKDFYPLPDEKVAEIRPKLWHDKSDKFVFINVNRNQPRKDMFRTMLAYKKLLDRRRAKGKDDVYLYLHCSIQDVGFNLIDISKQIDLVQGDEWAFPDPKVFGASKGVPLETLNEMYNAADAVITTTLGEGWGLSVTEGMAVKKPVIAPDHTSLTEMLGKTDGGGAERGFLVKNGGYFVQSNDNSRVRPFVDVDDMVDKMEYVVEHRDEVQPIVDSAYQWVSELQWGGSLVGAKWRALFEGAYNYMITVRGHAIKKEIEDEKFGKEKQRRQANRNKRKK